MYEYRSNRRSRIRSTNSSRSNSIDGVVTVAAVVAAVVVIAGVVVIADAIAVEALAVSTAVSVTRPMFYGQFPGRTLRLSGHRASSFQPGIAVSLLLLLPFLLLLRLLLLQTHLEEVIESSIELTPLDSPGS